MKMYLISDNIDTLTGMRPAAIRPKPLEIVAVSATAALAVLVKINTVPKRKTPKNATTFPITVLLKRPLVCSPTKYPITGSNLFL